MGEDKAVYGSDEKAIAQCGRPQTEVTFMPTFSTLPIGEARARSATGKRAALLQEVRRLHRARGARRGGEAGGRGGRDDAGDPAEVERGCDSPREADGVPAHGGYGLLVVGREATRQAAQEPG